MDNLKKYIKKLESEREDILKKIERLIPERAFISCHELQKQQLWLGLIIRDLKKLKP